MVIFKEGIFHHICLLPNTHKFKANYKTELTGKKSLNIIDISHEELKFKIFQKNKNCRGKYYETF